MGVMAIGADDRTQVLRVSLRAEARLLREWLARRDELARKRREAPLEARAHRRRLLERELPRLEREVSMLERRPATNSLISRGVVSAARGAGVVLAAALWTLGLALATPGGRFDEPLRLAAMAVAPLIIWVSRSPLSLSGRGAG